jgi:hypothetical protein
MFFHSCNENEKPGGIKGSKWRAGRCWLHWSDHHRNVCLEWSFWKPRLSVGIGLADYDHVLAGHFCIGLVNLYWHLDHYPLYQWIRDRIKRPDEKYGNGRTIGFTVFDDAIMIDLWNDPMESRGKDPKWWHIYILPKDVVLGRAKYSERVIRSTRVEVPMPEANYAATVEVQEATWKRPRWPWPHRMVRCEITPDVPIPFPGKGENSWDCGEDATHSMTCAATNEQEAVSALVASVLRDRYRHGGKHWRPKEVRA